MRLTTSLRVSRDPLAVKKRAARRDSSFAKTLAIPGPIVRADVR